MSSRSSLASSASSSFHNRHQQQREEVSPQELQEIERQWARFRRQNAKATEKVAAEEFHQQRVKRESGESIL